MQDMPPMSKWSGFGRRLAAACLWAGVLAQCGGRAWAQVHPLLGHREALETALLNNRQLQIERINPDIARLTLRASYGIYDPVFNSGVRQEESNDTGGFDPANFSADAVFSAESEIVTTGLMGYLPSGLLYTVNGSYAHSWGTRNFLNFDSYKVGAGITLEQPLLRDFWIDQPRWMIQVNKKNLKISDLGVEFIAMDVINRTQQSYFDLAFAWENLRVHQRLLETRNEFLRGIRRQVELGAMTALEEKFAQSQAASVQTALVTASNQVALASNELRTLMGVEGAKWSREFLYPTDYMVMLPEQFDQTESWERGLKQRPDLQQLAVNLESADLTVRFRKNQLFPSLNLVASYGLRGADALQAFPPDEPRASRSLAFRQIENQDAENTMIGILFSLPITRTAERANYKASKEVKKQAELLLRQKEEFVLREISDAIDLAQFSFQKAMAARDATAYAEEAMQAEQQKLLGGTGSIFFVLQAQTDAASARITEIMARRDYNKALSQLYFTEGTLLERLYLDLDFR